MKLVRRRFVCSLIAGIALCPAFVFTVKGQSDKSKNQPASEDTRSTTAKLDALEKRMEQGFNQLQFQIQTQVQSSTSTAYNFMIMATLFILGVTIFTGLNVNSSRKDFKDYLDRLERNFTSTLTQQTTQFQREVGELTSLMKNDFNNMKAEFETMRNQFKPAQEIINGVRHEFERPELLKRDTLIEVVSLLRDNSNNPEEFQRRLENELVRLGGMVIPPGSPEPRVQTSSAIEEGADVDRAKGKTEAGSQESSAPDQSQPDKTSE